MATSPSTDLAAIRAWVPLLDRPLPYALTLPEQRQLGSDLAVLCDRVEQLELAEAERAEEERV